MGKKQNDQMLDDALDYVSSGATQIAVCSTEPTTRAEAITTYMLALSAGAPTFQANADGDVSGRKLAVDEEADIAITTSDTALHIAIVSGADLLYVTTCTSQALTSGGTVTIPTWKIEIEDAA
jgi:hypothetical protein